MKLLFINESIFESYKSLIEKNESSYIQYKYTPRLKKVKIFYFVCNCGGKRPGNSNLCICWAKGPIRELKVARGQEKHFRKGSMLISEGMKSNRNHPRSNLRKNPPRLGNAEEKRYGLPLRAIFRTIPWNRISVKNEQDKGMPKNI